MIQLTPKNIRKAAQCIAADSYVEAFQIFFEDVTPAGNGVLELLSLTEREIPIHLTLIEQPNDNVSYAADLRTLYRQINLEMLFDSFRYQDDEINTQLTVKELSKDYEDWLLWFKQIVLIFFVAETTKIAFNDI